MSIEGPVYEIPTDRNPSYEAKNAALSSGLSGVEVLANPQDNAIPACSMSQDTDTSIGVGVKPKKPARGCPCSWVCIGLVLVGVVACVSMAVAVWSIVKVYDISNRCEAQKNGHVASEVVEQASSVDEIDALNITLNTAIDSIRSELIIILKTGLIR